MATATTRRKLADRGIPMTVWLPAGVVARIERDAHREKLSRSKFAAKILQKAMTVTEPPQPAAA